MKSTTTLRQPKPAPGGSAARAKDPDATLASSAIARARARRVAGSSKTPSDRPIADRLDPKEPTVPNCVGVLNVPSDDGAAQPETRASAAAPDTGMRVLVRAILLFFVLPAAVSYLAKLLWR